MKTFAHPAQLAPLVGERLGASGWRSIGQPLIDSFAANTGDEQWIHTDPRRARNGPFGSTVAHGYLVLAMVPGLLDEVITMQGVRLVLNKEVRKAKFLTPVPVGSRVRLDVTLQSARSRPRGFWEACFLIAAELEGQARPAVSAEQVFLYQES
jgi:acyl dehydratase